MVCPLVDTSMDVESTVPSALTTAVITVRPCIFLAFAASGYSGLGTVRGAARSPTWVESYTVVSPPSASAQEVGTGRTTCTCLLDTCEAEHAVAPRTREHQTIRPRISRFP